MILNTEKTFQKRGVSMKNDQDRRNLLMDSLKQKQQIYFYVSVKKPLFVSSLFVSNLLLSLLPVLPSSFFLFLFYRFEHSQVFILLKAPMLFSASEDEFSATRRNLTGVSCPVNELHTLCGFRARTS